MTKAAPESLLQGVAVTGNFSLQCSLPQGKTFTVSGYIYDGESVESLSHRVDLLHDACDRQRTRAEIPELELVLESKLKHLEDAKTHYAALNQKKEQNGKLTGQEKSALDVQDIALTRALEDIQKGRDKIAEARAKVGL